MKIKERIGTFIRERKLIKNLFINKEEEGKRQGELIRNSVEICLANTDIQNLYTIVEHLKKEIEEIKEEKKFN